MQAPHRPAPQPNLVPVSFKSSRITHSSGVSGGASVVAALPFTRKLVVIAASLDPRAAQGRDGPRQSSCGQAGMAMADLVRFGPRADIPLAISLAELTFWSGTLHPVRSAF